jgi:quercetin dioxygenase-like cupin family protein
VKRHPALIPLSHDHHHALVEARRLRRSAEEAADPADAAEAFAAFFAGVTVPHFREEEEQLFPLVAGSEEAAPLVVQALVDHQRLHALAAQLGSADDHRATMVELADLLEEHVRREERELFPLIERLAGAQLEEHDAGREGPLWGLASGDLNATLLAWRPGHGPGEHVNDERDVLVFVVDGSAVVTVDGSPRELRAGDAVIVEKGRPRSLSAGAHGVRYLSVHLRRPPLQIRGRGQAAAPP